MTPTADFEMLEVEKALRQHHIESSMDCFNEFQQMVYLAPGQRLAYRTLFSGLYNDVSQVIFFHHPRFCRKAQMDLKDIAAHPMHMLPLVTQLLPQIPILYDDDTDIPGLTRRPGGASAAATAAAAASSSDAGGGGGGGGRWAWLVACGAIFLLDMECSIVFTHERLAALVAHYLRENRQHVNIGGASSQAHGSAAAVGVALTSNTPFNHVQLMAPC